MLTYKTNNTGEDVSHESTNLFNFDDLSLSLPKDFIDLAAPTASGMSNERKLMNRSHAFTANAMKRFNEDSQMNFQLVYNNERDKAWGDRQTEYILANGNRIISNNKSWRSKENDLYALLKYEHNSTKSYLKNSLSADMKWLSQRLGETGADSRLSNIENRLQHSRLPVFDFRDNLYVIRKYGKTLISFYSDNVLQQRPQHLYVDSLIQQDISQRFYSTNTYASGGWKLGRFSLSMKMGVNGLLRYIKANAYGLPDSLGVTKDKSHFGYAKFYASPQVEYVTKDVKFTVSVPFEEAYYKYSADKGHNRFDVSPLVHIRWDATSRLSMSLRASYDVQPLDFNRFFGSLIMQDYLYLNQGYKGYDVSTSKSVTYNIRYRNSLQGTHLSGSVSRSFNTDPYTISREFVGDYIIIGTEAVKTKNDSWNATMMYQQGLPFLSGKFTLRSLYTHNNSKMFQNGELYPSKYNMLMTRGSIYLSPYQDMSIDYSVSYNYNDMRPESGTKSSFHRWQHEGRIIIPVGKLHLDLHAEYNHNQITDDKYKDAFFADVTCGYRFKHFDVDLKLNNILNKKSYSYTVVSDLMTTCSTTILRGRECLLTFIYKP